MRNGVVGAAYQPAKVLSFTQPPETTVTVVAVGRVSKFCESVPVVYTMSA